jgi:endoglucanase
MAVMRTAALLALVVAASTATVAVPVAAAPPAPVAAAAATPEPTGPELISNGTFDSGHSPWFATANITIDATTPGKFCAVVPAGTTKPSAAIVGYNNVPLVKGERYRLVFTASATIERLPRALVQLNAAPFTPYLEAVPDVVATPGTYSYTFVSPVDLPNASLQFQVGGNGASDPWTFCLDDVSLRGGAAPDIYVPDTGPRVRVNQVGYLPDGPKRATLVTAATKPLRWQLRSASGRVQASGRTTPRGVDISSAQNVHSIDFTHFTRQGTGYTLVADGQTSRPFDIDRRFYDSLRTDALKVYYLQRSGIEIRDDLRPGYARPAGHVGVAPNTGDTAVPCAPGGCDYTLDVSGGWYDAGDHGKYVVNGGISVYQLMNLWERSGDRRALGDRTLAIPESGNGVPDVLDEARWEQEFLLKMQVPADKPLAGMAFAKAHDAAWTGLPLLPNLDPQRRQLYPPTTAATLNLAATAAQAARVFRPYDRAFASRNLAAARTAWEAANANPALFAPATSVGGGPYADTQVADEFYWAAAELYLTTGEKQYRDAVLASPLHTAADVFTPGGFYWGSVAALARLDLALLPSNLPDRRAVRASVITAADSYLATQRAQPYGVPYAPNDNKWDWGSNSGILNIAAVLGVAGDLTGRDRYRDGVIETMDYILGRNALNQSYVTGYGEVASHNQHTRWYAHSLDLTMPNPPVGTIAGGANSGIQDPLAHERLAGCVAQFCYIDQIQSYSTNELAINWNAPLAWVAAYISDRSGGHDR